MNAGFTPDKIMEMEVMRKEQSQPVPPSNRQEAFIASGYEQKIAESEKRQKDLFGGFLGSIPTQIGNI